MAASGKKLFPGIQFSKGDITLEHGQKSFPPQGSSQPGLGPPLSETLSRQNKPAVTENISGSGACWFSVFLKGKGRSWWNCLLHGPQLCLQDHSHRGGKIKKALYPGNPPETLPKEARMAMDLTQFQFHLQN